jgi:hypothetical protein
VYVNKVYVNKVYVNKVYVNKVYVNKVYVNKVYVNKVYVNKKMCDFFAYAMVTGLVKPVLSSANSVATATTAYVVSFFQEDVSKNPNVCPIDRYHGFYNTWSGEYACKSGHVWTFDGVTKKIMPDIHDFSPSPFLIPSHTPTVTRLRHDCMDDSQLRDSNLATSHMGSSQLRDSNLATSHMGQMSTRIGTNGESSIIWSKMDEPFFSLNKSKMM